VLAARLLFRNYTAGELTGELVRESEAHRRHIRRGDPMVDFKGQQRITPQRALAEIRELRQTPGLDREQQDLLNDLERDIANRWSCEPEARPRGGPTPA